MLSHRNLRGLGCCLYIWRSTPAPFNRVFRTSCLLQYYRSLFSRYSNPLYIFYSKGLGYTEKEISAGLMKMLPPHSQMSHRDIAHGVPVAYLKPDFSVNTGMAGRSCTVSNIWYELSHTPCHKTYSGVYVYCTLLDLPCWWTFSLAVIRLLNQISYKCKPFIRVMLSFFIFWVPLPAGLFFRHACRHGLSLAPVGVGTQDTAAVIRLARSKLARTASRGHAYDYVLGRLGGGGPLAHLCVICLFYGFFITKIRKLTSRWSCWTL